MAAADNVENWQTMLNGRRQEYNILFDETRQLALRMETEGVRNIITAQDGFKQRDVLMDKAYETLVTFVEDLLKYTDGGAEIGSNGVPSLPTVVQCFKSLAEFCEGLIDAEGIEAVQAMQGTGEDGQIVQRVNLLKTILCSDMNGLLQAYSRAKETFDTNHEHHMNARDALNKAEDRKNDFFYKVFGDSDIDRAADSCRNNERSWHTEADRAWDVWDRLLKLHQSFQPLDGELVTLTRILDEQANKFRLEYTKIGEERKIDEKCWIASRTLQYHVTTNTEYTSRDDALRHVIKLLHTVNQTIDGDSDVAGFKEQIEKRIRETLGEEMAELLHQEKRYLNKPEDMGF